MKKFIGVSMIVVFAFIGVFEFLAPPVEAQDPFTGRRHSWTGLQRFRKGINSMSGNTITLKSGSAFVADSGSNLQYNQSPQFNKAIVQKMVTPSITSGTGFVIAGTEGRTYLINTTVNEGTSDTTIGPADGAGNTVTLPTPTQALDGAIFTIIKSDSGATDIFIYSSELPIGNASGTTDALTIDALGDAITVQASYGTGVSYWVISSDIE